MYVSLQFRVFVRPHFKLACDYNVCVRNCFREFCVYSFLLACINHSIILFVCGLLRGLDLGLGPGCPNNIVSFLYACIKS